MLATRQPRTGRARQAARPTICTPVEKKIALGIGMRYATDRPTDRPTRAARRVKP